MRTIRIENIEDGKPKQEIIFDMQPDHMERKLSGSISRELNCADSLSFDIYPDNPGYDMLSPCLTKIWCVDTPEIEFLGRVLKAVPLMDNTGAIYKQVTCEGYLAYLQDSSTEIEAFDMSPVELAKELIDRHNSNVPEHQFVIEFDATVTDTQKAELSTSGGTTFDELSALISKYGWEISVSYKMDLVEGKALFDKLTVSKKIGKICGDSVIEIGYNLLSYSCEQDMSTLCTRILPLGQKIYTDEDNLERVSIAGVNGGNKYLSKNEDVYGVIQRTVLYEDINDPTELLKEAQKYIDIYSVPYSSYTISAIDPHNLNGNKERIQVGNWYKVNAKMLGIDGVMLRVNKQTISLDSPANDSFSVGSTAATASGSIAGAVTGEKLSLLADQSNTNNIIVTKQLAAQQAWINDLVAVNITTDNLKAKVAEIDSLTANDAIIKNIIAQTITTDNISAAVGNIKNLTSESALINNIRSTIITTDFSDAVVGRMSDGVITNALIKSLTADKIASGTIYTDNVQIQSKDGTMVLKDSTMQISDGKKVRVQIGKDANNNYTIIIYDANGNVQWDREHKHYECDIVRLSKKYSYVNNSFMPLDGTAYTLSAYIKGRAMIYYPTALETGDVFDNAETTRVKYDFVYDSTKGKPVFTPADDDGVIEIYAIKLEYGGAMTEFCLSADEEEREGRVQMANFEVSNTNLKYELYEKNEENQQKFSQIDVNIDGIKETVGVIQGDYVTSAALNLKANEINAKVSETYQTIDGMNNYAKSSELDLKADSATLGNYQTIAGMSSYATTQWAQGQINSKVSVGGVCSEINQSSEQIALNSNRLVVNSTNFKLDGSGNGSIGGWHFGNGYMYSDGEAFISTHSRTGYYSWDGFPYKATIMQGKLICGIQSGALDEAVPDTTRGYCDFSVAGIFAKDKKMSSGYLFAVGTENGVVTTNTGAFTASDRRLKTNITEIDEQYANDLIDGLKPSTYTMIDGKRTHSGFIADEVKMTAEKVLGTVDDFAAYATVQIDEDKKDYAALRYEEFIAPLTKYCQCLKRDLKQEIEGNRQLQSELLKLQCEVMTIKAKLEEK